jgi:hypothetical protein
MFVKPREHGKTMHRSFTYPLWLLLIGASYTTATENCRRVPACPCAVPASGNIGRILRNEVATFPAQRDKVYRWLKRIVFNLGKSAFIVHIRTTATARF